MVYNNYASNWSFTCFIVYLMIFAFGNISYSARHDCESLRGIGIEKQHEQNMNCGLIKIIMSSLPDSSSGVSSRMWVRIPVVTLVSLSKTLNHNCFVLRMGRKAVGPVCCVIHVKEPRTLIVKEKGLAPVFLEWQLNAPKLFAPRNRFL